MGGIRGAVEGSISTRNTVSDVLGEYFHKRLYEVGEIVRKLIAGAVTC